MNSIRIGLLVLAAAVAVLAVAYYSTLLANNGKVETSRGRMMGRILATALCVLLSAEFLAVGERIYFVNANHYPSWLTDGEMPGSETLGSLREGQCKDFGPIEINPKSNGSYVVRCGFLWFRSRVYLAHTNPLDAPGEH